MKISEIRSQFRFFLDRECFADGQVTFPEDVARQITRVLRLKTGAELIALDNSGKEFHVAIDVEGNLVRGRILRHELNQAEPLCRLHLFQAMPKPRKFEQVLRQCTEVGVSEFTPVISERSSREGEIGKRRRRYVDVVREAAEQCGRGRMPIINQAAQLPDLFAGSLTGVFFSNEDNMAPSRLGHLSDKAGNGRLTINVFVGPEGGFSPTERERAGEIGLQVVSLGPRTFRVDTAAAVACAMVLRDRGDI